MHHVFDAMPGIRYFAWLLACAFVLVGCDAPHPVNTPIATQDLTKGYRLQRVKADPDNPGDVLVILTLSGGGTRAAALAYGTMEALRDVKLRMGGRSRRLLDEVDVINAVSGGSIVAAYYAVHREGLFRDFESRFLKRDVERQIRAEVFANLPRLAQPQFSRGELLAEYFDRELFNGATYSDLARGSMRPFVVINASALATGARFPFTQAQFDLLCSDLSSVSVARAVAASAALPPFFGAITIDSYAGSCGPVMLPGIADETTPTRVVRLEEARTYLDRSRRPYVHLVDGGLIDNLGLRVAGDFAVEQGGFFELVDALGYRNVSHVVFISVNAETASNHAIDQNANTPNFLQTLNALKLPGSAHSSEVAEQLRASFEGWRNEVRKARRRTSVAAGTTSGEGPQFYFIDVSLQAIVDESERNSFQSIPTALTLDAATVDRLRAVARKLLLASPDFRKLIADLGN
jgi:NTE family protein